MNTAAPRAHSVMAATDSELEAFLGEAVPPEAGATVTFVGAVRNHDNGRRVSMLEYEAHPNASVTLAEVVADIIAAHPQVLHLRIVHRHGLLRIGDRALVAEVSAAHRAAAFTACSELVEQVKRRLPVWKRQVFADGTDEWVNSP